MIRVRDGYCADEQPSQTRVELDELRSSAVVTLHGLGQSGTTSTVDHLVVAPSGIWVIATMTFKLEVRAENVGGRRSTEIRLYVGGRDRTALTWGIANQAEVIRRVLADTWPDVPVRPALSFVDAVWPRFAKPFAVQGVHVFSPKTMADAVREAGPIAPAQVDQIAAQLAEALDPA